VWELRVKELVLFVVDGKRNQKWGSWRMEKILRCTEPSFWWQK
jgi:hypothetical protein